MNKSSKLNEFIKSVIPYFHWFSIVIGSLLLIIAFLLKNSINKKQTSLEILRDLSLEMSITISGALLSIGLVTIFYQKWKDKQENEKKEKYFLMGPSFLGSGEELKEIANIDKESGKILLIGDVTETGAVKDEYGFVTLLQNDNLKLLKQGEPLFSYGTSFSFLNRSDTRGYYKTITNAIKEGLGLKVSILYPDKRIIDNPKIENVIDKSICTIKDFKDLINLYIDKGLKCSAPIELRLSREFSPCSFSSIEYSNGRTIRSLEFNFMHEGQNGKKMTQVHDNYPLKNSKNDVHGTFSQYLYNRYERLYQESFLALKYPMEVISYYVMGIIVDDIPELSTKQTKEAIVDSEGQLIKIDVTLDDNNGCLSYKVGDDRQTYSNEIVEEKYVGLGNTIIGNVLYGYEKLTGCAIVPYWSFEIKDPTGSTSSNKFILLGRIQQTPPKTEIFKRIDVVDDESKIYSKLREIVRDPNAEAIRKIQRIIKVS